LRSAVARAAHRQQDSALDELVVVAGPVAPQQLHLKMIQRFEIREAVEHRTGQRRVVGQEVVVARDQPVHADGALVLVDYLVEHPPPQRLVLDQFRVSRRKAHIRLRKNLSHIRQHGAEEGPPPVEILQTLQPAVLFVDPVFERRPRAVPAGQHDARLAPCQHPRNRPQVGYRGGGLARRGSAADVERPDLANRCGSLEVVDETGCLMDQFGIGAVRACRQVVEHLIGRSRLVPEPFDVEQRRLEGSGDQRLQIAVVNRRDPFTAPGGCARMAS
jgi:hypothetical protein